VIREHQNRRVIPIEIEKFDFIKMEQVDYVDLFMEAYHLYKKGFKYSYNHEDMEPLRQLYEDYIQKTDIDMVLDIQVMVPESENEIHHISTLDLVTSIFNLYPQYGKRLNVVNIGKLLNDRGFRSIRKGKNKTTYYEISNRSEVLNLKITPPDGTVFLG